MNDRRGRRPNHYGWLLLSLLLLFLVLPFLGYVLEWRNVPLLGVFLALVLLSAVRAASLDRRGVFVGSLILAVPAVATSFLPSLAGGTAVLAARWLLVGAFLFYTAATVLVDVNRARRVTADTVRGALAVYLLLGVAWATLYPLVELAWPGSFRLPPDMAAGAPAAAADSGFPGFVYFSFVTQTTLGYGDITPVTPPARTLAVLQAVIGQLFLVVTVARLVALHIAHAPSAGRENGSTSRSE